MTTFKADIRRYKAYQPRSILFHFLTQRGLWAIFQYRVANYVFRSKLPRLPKRLILGICSVWRFLTEILTGISLPHSCTVGSGLYIGHAGNIIINGNAVIGNYCNISQGVTIGVSGRGIKRGVPTIGNYVYISANAVIAGKIKVGDGVVVGANSLVIEDVRPNVTVLGVPARIISERNSSDYILPVA